MDRARAAAHDLAAGIAAGRLPALAVAYDNGDLAELEALANWIRSANDDVLIIGTGGSGLGARAATALGRDGGPRLHFCDNLDAESLSRLFESIDPARLFLLAISKSGATAEVMAQTLVALPLIEAATEGKTAEHALVIADPGPRPLRALAGVWSLPVIDHPPDIGGRFSVLSAVGMLPALVAGLDAAAFRAGARAVLKTLTVDDCAPAFAAARLAAFAHANPSGVHALMPYADRLGPFALWFRQLWGESLGKGGRGTTPVAALGPVDQHSQLQLWLDGPGGTFLSVITVDGAPGPKIDLGVARAEGIEGLDYLSGRTLGEVIAANARATTESLRRRGRPVRVLEMAGLDEAALGALFAHFMAETILVARLNGTDPFDQPAVDEGKRLTREYLAGGGTA